MYVPLKKKKKKKKEQKFGEKKLFTYIYERKKNICVNTMIHKVIN